MYRRIFKPFLDFIISLLVLIILSPILIILIVSLSISNHGCPFFVQLRPGLNEKEFRIIKFKTMTDARDENGILLPDADRLTKIGKLVRSSSVDELPQLLNVIAGDMSIVGPRPLLPDYLPFYNESQKRRHLVKPGITGWAQVNGRNSIDWEKKFELDIWYVSNISFLVDIKIIRMTIKNVFLTKGISAVGHVSMPRFDKLNNKKND